MKLYDDSNLKLFKQKAPFFTHPYEHWCKEKSLHPAVRSLEKMVHKLLYEENFELRLIEARKQVNDPLNFYTFITEIVVADFLKTKAEKFEILKSDNVQPMPDFKANGIYLEVNMLHKNFIILKRLEEELMAIDSRFCFERRRWNPVRLPDGQKTYNEITAILKHYKGNSIDISPKKIWQSDDINNPLIGVLTDSDANYSPGHNQQSCPQSTIFVYLKESLNNKIKPVKSGLAKELQEEREHPYVMKNDLNNRHPNILWSEFMFLEDFQNSSAIKSFDWKRYGLPEKLDAQIISVIDFEEGINFNKPQTEQITIEIDQVKIELPLHSGFLVTLLINKKAKQDNIEKVEEFLKCLFPGNNIIKLEKTAEELKLLDK
jgi:hypothetical protein